MQPMYFIDQNYGWIGAEQGKILHTTDGGLTWGLQETSATNRPIHRYPFHQCKRGLGYCPAAPRWWLYPTYYQWWRILADFRQDEPSGNRCLFS
ncbi:TPA: hypothetical protein EYO63_08885 [Candidatus Poribacteria bacterium]|nr:hypothetical protein [Candidatus Poribacteria bacterium]